MGRKRQKTTWKASTAGLRDHKRLALLLANEEKFLTWKKYFFCTTGRFRCLNREYTHGALECGNSGSYAACGIESVRLKRLGKADLVCVAVERILFSQQNRETQKLEGGIRLLASILQAISVSWARMWWGLQSLIWHGVDWVLWAYSCGLIFWFTLHRQPRCTTHGPFDSAISKESFIQKSDRKRWKFKAINYRNTCKRMLFNTKMSWKDTIKQYLPSIRRWKASNRIPLIA